MRISSLLGNILSLMLRSMYKRLIVLLVVPVIVTGCISFSNSQNQAAAVPAAGLFKTNTKGETWAQKGSLYTVAAAPQFVSYGDIKFMKFDLLDSNTIYVGTDAGLYYSYNRGEGWFKTLEGKGVVNDIAIDPQDKCTLYVAINIYIYKTTDCGRTWNMIHFSSLAGQFFTSLLVSRSDSTRVFVGASDGTMLYSKNAGLSWEVFRTFESTIITKLLQHPKDPRSFYVVTPRYGIQQTKDDGLTWRSLHELPVRHADGTQMMNANNTPTLLRDLYGSVNYNDLQFDSSQEDGLIYASGYGIFRLLSGEYWQQIEILSKPAQEVIYTVALDPTGINMYFATNGAFYRSENAGKDWSVRKLPASGQPRFLLAAPDAVGELYLGFYAPPQQ